MQSKVYISWCIDCSTYYSTSPSFPNVRPTHNRRQQSAITKFPNYSHKIIKSSETTYNVSTRNAKQPQQHLWSSHFIRRSSRTNLYAPSPSLRYFTVYTEKWLRYGAPAAAAVAAEGWVSGNRALFALPPKESQTQQFRTARAAAAYSARSFSFQVVKVSFGRARARAHIYRRTPALSAFRRRRCGEREL